jgi:RimJ/RimL family protein N-acetyltransferase
MPPVVQQNEILIEAHRLWLRSMRADDVDSLLAIFTDPKVMNAFQSPPFSPEQMLGWLQRNLDHQATYGYGLFSVILKQNELLIGDCGLETMEIDGLPAAELGYDFRSDYWNQGYATEAALAVRDYAVHHLNLPRLISLIRVGNLPSKRVAEKIGMQYIGDYQNDDRPYWKYELDTSGDST